ncbi:MAG: VWA domain-containing protein [Actinomycetota bacterium]
MNQRSLTILTVIAVLTSACSSGVTAPPATGWLGGEPEWRNLSLDAYGGVSLAEVAPGAIGSVDGLDGGRRLGLRAGAVDDNAAWDDYLLYRQRFLESGIEAHDVDVSGRRIVTVTRTDGSPVLGAAVTLLDAGGAVVAGALTTSDGTARLFPVGDIGGMTISAAVGGESASTALDEGAREHHLTLDAPPSPSPIALDVLFLIDVTGSMGDEIDRLKATVETIAERIDALDTETDLRLAMTVYRDRGDSFVARTFEFTPDVAAFATALAAVTADGGGDYPESLNEGLHEAVHAPEWRVEDAVGLIFLIADAPPVLTYQDDFDYAVEMLAAAERGITIYPIASSGLDDQGEYVFRQLAQATGGRFVFLTYGAGGGSGDETTHHVDDYSVLSLDDLVVTIVEDTLAPLEG